MLYTGIKINLPLTRDPRKPWKFCEFSGFFVHSRPSTRPRNWRYFPSPLTKVVMIPVCLRFLPKFLSHFMAVIKRNRSAWRFRLTTEIPAKDKLIKSDMHIHSNDHSPRPLSPLSPWAYPLKMKITHFDIKLPVGERVLNLCRSEYREWRLFNLIWVYYIPYLYVNIQFTFPGSCLLIYVHDFSLYDWIKNISWFSLFLSHSRLCSSVWFTHWRMFSTFWSSPFCFCSSSLLLEFSFFR